MSLILFRNLTEKDKAKAVEHLIQASTPSKDFFLMIILSIITVTFGLLLNNVAVIIGSMLIAPMLYSFLSLSLGITIADGKFISRSFYTITKAWAFGVTVATIVAVFFSPHMESVSNEILLRTEATLPYIIIALATGFAGSFALVKPTIITGSILLFLINAVGIVLSGITTLSLTNFYIERRQAIKTVEKEDKKVEREFKKAEMDSKS